MTKYMNPRRVRQAITTRQLHVVLSMIDSGLDLLGAHPVKEDKRIDSALETIRRWQVTAFSNLDPLSSNRAVKSKNESFTRIKQLIEDMFPDGEFSAEEWMHFWLAVNMQLDYALILDKVSSGSRAPWRYMEKSSLKLIRALAGPKEPELYEVGNVADTDPLLGTAVGEALTEIVWGE